MEHGTVAAFLDFGKDVLEISGHKPKPVGIVMLLSFSCNDLCRCCCEQTGFYYYSTLIEQDLSRLPRWLSGKESACQCRSHRRCGFGPLVGKIPWRRKQQPTLGFLPGTFHGQRSLVGYSPWGVKESDRTDQLSMHARRICLGLEFCRVYRTERETRELKV